MKIRLQPETKVSIYYLWVFCSGIFMGSILGYALTKDTLLDKVISQCGDKAFTANTFKSGKITKPGFQFICRKREETK